MRLRGTGRLDEPGPHTPREPDPAHRRLAGPASSAARPDVTSPGALDLLGPRAMRGFGLSSREARLYLTLILHGPQDARRVTEGSDLHRATGYRVLARLLARGLVRSDRRWPREYSPLPLRVLVDRNVTFLRDEIELRHWLVQTFPGTHEPPVGGPPVPPVGDVRHAGGSDLGTPTRASATSLALIGRPPDSPILNELENVRSEVVALVRPRMLTPGLRTRVAASLVRAATEGRHVRLVLDYLTADRRFATQLRRDLSTRGSTFELRHFTPLGAHLYVIDNRVALRFPVLADGSKEAGFGFVTRDPYFVRAQIARFEAVWVDSVGRRAPPASSATAPREGSTPAGRTLAPPEANSRWAGDGPRPVVR